MSRTLILPLALVFTGVVCTACGDKPDDTGPDTDDTQDTQDDTGETDVPDSIPPCSDGSWGYVDEDNDAVIHVRADGSDEDGDGTAAYPLATIEAALELTRVASGDKIIGVGAGTYDVNLNLSDTTDDNDTVIQGCSTAETILEGAVSDTPVLSVSGATNVVIEGLTSRGGTRGIQVWSEASVTMNDILVEDSYSVGVVINGNGTVAVLNDVYANNSRTFSDGSNGYGFAFQEGADVTMTGGGAYDNTGVGILVSDVNAATFDAIIVEGTQQNGDGYYGRGIQIQDFADSINIEGECEFNENHDAGVFSLTTLAFTMDNSFVRDTVASNIPDMDKLFSGDGVVITRGEDNLNPAHYLATVSNNTIEGSARAAVVFDGVTAVEENTTLSGNLTDMVAQGPAEVDSVDVELLDETSALGLNLEPMAAVDFTDAP